MDIKTIVIDNIGLSVRTSNALHRAGINTVGEMMEYTEETLSKIRNMGQKSVEEVLLKIEEYKRYDLEGEMSDLASQQILPDMPEDFGAWYETDEGRDFIKNWLIEKKVKTSELELLSAKSFNYLLLNGLEDLDQVVFLSADKLMEIPRMDLSSANEIVKMCRVYLNEHQAEILDDLKKHYEEVAGSSEISVGDLIHSIDEHDRILQYIQANDCEVKSIGFSTRAENILINSGFSKVSDFIFSTMAELKRLKGMGAGSLQEIQTFIDNYLAKHESRIRAFCGGDESAICDEELVRTLILATYNRIGFEGLSLREAREKTDIPEQVPDEMLKSVFGRLIANGDLEYVDFRCYRIYPKFADYVAQCSKLEERTKDFLGRRLQGETLESIATDYNMTRERVRQIVSKAMNNIRGYLLLDTGMEWFDEDYYRAFYEMYAFDKKDAETWLGISKETISYLELSGMKKGTGDLQEAADDYHNLDLGFRLKIKNYLNRNKLYLDGRWVNKSRADLEKYVVKKYCTDNVTYEDFIHIYNEFLKREEVPYDESIYYTDAVKRTRENKLMTDRYLLWKQNRQIRYYDIDGQDFSELLDVLNLNAYENVEYSTVKFMRDHPEIMEKYDIRDQYELHNLLRKIVKDGDYHDFHCDRTPMIRFGTFDKAGAILDIMIDNAPVSQADLIELISQEYGYDPATVLGTYLQPISAYYHQGMYTIDQKAMLGSNKEALLAALTEDFYYIDEIRKIYARVVPNADIEEVNPYNLKTMGFTVLTRYVYRNHSTLEAYFRDILTREDITDITPYRRKYAYVVAFSNTLYDMKNDMEILEFEPNQIITFRRLASVGVTREELRAFCDEVADYVEDETYFSVQSMKKNGFQSDLFDLGFSDWFYASLLTSDNRFSNMRALSNIILYKGEKRISLQSFEETLINEQGSIDVYDLMTEMEETYGCNVTDRLDLIYKVSGTDVVYDKYLDRLYANTSIFDRELDAVEGM